jgi:thiol-disulfide isomerase/thioredoxin
MKKFLSLTVLLLSVLYSFAQTCEITGTAKPVIRQIIYLFGIEDGEPKLLTSARLAQDGSFRFSFTPKYEGFYVLGSTKLLGGQSPLYLKAGDKAEVAIDDKRIQYLGKQTPENTVLAAWNSLTEELKIKSVYYTNRPASTYNDFFPALTAVAAVADSFRKTINTTNVRFNRLMKSLTYFDLDFYALNFLATPRAVQPKVEELVPYYKTIVVKDKFKNDDILATLFGRKFLELYADYAVGPKNTEGGLRYLATDRQKGIYVLSKEEQGLKTYALFTQLMDRYGKYFKSPTLKAKVEKLGAKLFHSTAGLKGSFSFPDKDSTMVSLADLKGKVVLVDVWATYCLPCIAGMPSLKKLEEELHDKEIAFVSVAVDGPKARNTWLKMIKEKDLGGIQLFAGGGNNILMKDYGIKVMPRFLVFDHAGNLVTADAPHPGSPELKTILLNTLAANETAAGK